MDLSKFLQFWTVLNWARHRPAKLCSFFHSEKGMYQDTFKLFLKYMLIQTKIVRPTMHAMRVGAALGAFL